MNQTTNVDRNPIPQYTYGSASTEIFPGTFPTVRKEGVGVAADVSTPTSEEAKGKEKSWTFLI
jgi:hypothetical protein